MLRRIGWAALALAVVQPLAVAQEAHETGLAAYRRFVVLLESRKASVEQLFDHGLFVRDTLLKPDQRGTTLLEALSSGEFDDLKREFSGFVLGRDEVVYVNPDPAYFSRVAREYGDAADQAFFDAYRQTRPTGVWPAWIDQQTDATGCTRFGDGELVAAYRRWTDFRQAHPRKYRTEAEDFLSSIEYEVSTATCACGDSAATLKELQEFDRSFPNTRVSESVRQRIRELEQKRSSMRFACTSGPAARVVR